VPKINNKMNYYNAIVKLYTDMRSVATLQMLLDKLIIPQFFDYYSLRLKNMIKSIME